MWPMSDVQKGELLINQSLPPFSVKYYLESEDHIVSFASLSTFELAVPRNHGNVSL